MLKTPANPTNAQAFAQGGEGVRGILGQLGHLIEAAYQRDSKLIEAKVSELQADAQLEQGTKETLLQALNAIKSMIEALLNTYREIRDAQDQTKANIARNA